MGFKLKVVRYVYWLLAIGYRSKSEIGADDRYPRGGAPPPISGCILHKSKSLLC